MRQSYNIFQTDKQSAGKTSAAATSKKHYRKPDSIKVLEEMANAAARAAHPSVDPKYLAPRVYKDNSANSLTRAIIDYLRLTGSQAERINCTGRPVDNTLVYENVLGDLRKIGSTTWIPTSGQKGTSDISATIRGMSVKIEVKQRDSQSPDQVKYQQQVEAAGGKYWLIRSFDSFMEQYNNL